jgi:hypothetical protein
MILRSNSVTRLTKRASSALFVVLLALVLAGCGKEEDGEEEKALPEGALEKVYERGPLKVVLTLDNPTPTIADQITFVMEMAVSEDYEVTPPKFGEKLEEFGISDFTEAQPKLDDHGVVRSSRTYLLEPFLSGDYVIPAMTFRFRKADDSEEKGHELETEEIVVVVSSLLPEEADDLEIHEIEPPAELAKPTSHWLWPLLGGGLAVILAVLFMVFWPRRKNGLPKGVRIPAHEIAFAALEKLVADDLAEKGELKHFYQRISDILRHYIENRFGLQAPDRTTEEFLHELRSGGGLDEFHQPLLGRFLQHCDLVKFAEHQPSRDDIQETFDSCKNFILETKDSALAPARP